jgi:hypothetical protein
MPMKTMIRLFLAFLCLSAAGPKMQAVDPPPGGGYPDGNTAVGTEALLDLTTGQDNTALGFRALTDNTQGNLNTAVGSAALKQNRIGSRNTATGFHALDQNRFGNNNTANGYVALGGLNSNAGNNNTAVGAFALNGSTGDNNIALGFRAGSSLTTGNQNIDIGNLGVAGESGAIRIGSAAQTRTFIAGISGQAVSGSPVYVNAGGQLGVLPSSERFKEEIKPMDNASEAILEVEPVTFHYKKDLDPNAVSQFGLVAEKLASASPDLVERDDQGRPYTVRYDAVNAMLLNEFLKEHRRVQDLECALDELSARLKEQGLQVHKMSEQLAAAGLRPGGRALQVVVRH